MQPAGAIEANCTLILEQVRRTGSTKILNDSAQDEDGWALLIGWLAHNFFPQLAAHGVEAVAWVLPGNVRARGDVHRAVSAIARPLTDVFADAEAAYSWLRHLPAAGGGGPDAPPERPTAHRLGLGPKLRRVLLPSPQTGIKKPRPNAGAFLYLRFSATTDALGRHPG